MTVILQQEGRSLSYVKLFGLKIVTRLVFNEAEEVRLFGLRVYRRLGERASFMGFWL